MIKTYNITPDWVYRVVYMIGRFNLGDKLSEAALTAKPLVSHVARVHDATPKIDYENGSVLGRLMIPQNKWYIKVQYTTGGQHDFEAIEFQYFLTDIDNPKHFILFKAIEGNELVWYVGKPLAVTN